MSLTIHPIIPENERYCIWMDAGLVDYQLCSADDRCDTCAVDARVRRAPVDAHVRPAPSAAADAAGAAAHAVMSAQTAEEYCAATLETLIRSIDHAGVPGDRRYAPNHGWAKQEGDGTVVIGVDHFIGTLLSGVHAVACSVPSTHIRAYEPYAWIVSGAETIAVHAPVGGTITATNAALGARSGAVHTDPYGSGWIARLTPDDRTTVPALLAPDAMTSLLHTDCERYRDAVNAELRRIQVQLEGTMYDGGTVLDNFEEILGTRLYYTMIERFLRSA